MRLRPDLCSPGSRFRLARNPLPGHEEYRGRSENGQSNIRLGRLAAFQAGFPPAGGL